MRSPRQIHQDQLDTRAIEMASAAQALLNQHLIECRDRYLALQSLIVRSTGGIIVLLLGVIGYLVAHMGIPKL